MKVIKDTMPNEYHVKDGYLGYDIGFQFGIPSIKSGLIQFPLRPKMVFRVDKKEAGEYQCEATASIISTLPIEQIYLEAYKHFLMTMLEFNTQLRQNFAIPPSIVYKPGTYEIVKPELIKNLRTVVGSLSN